MSAEYDSELRMAVAEGLLSREEAEVVKQEASRLGRHPMELLVERGRLSADTLASLRREAHSEPVRDTGDPHNDSTLDIPPREEQATNVPGFPVTGWKRYQCLRLLGQGGMGRVFLAHDLQLRRDVALKFVRDDDPDHMHRFVSEARSQARVSHERVCQVFEVGEVQGRTYIAMQYIDGSPLHQLAKELTLEQKILVMREVAEGVHAAHRAGLIHRDIKPSNIMVERSDSGLLKPYVMDFGLARDWKEGLTVTGSVMGTPHYMAPEQARGEVSRLDRRADVYSLGATLYHLLTGVVPIPGSNSLEVLNNISTLEPRPPRSVDKDIPPDLEAIILKCMEKERSARYDSARALAEELERFLNGEPVLARSPGLWYRLRKRARKHRSLVTVASGALVLLILSMGWAGLALRATKQEAARELQATELEASLEDLTRRPYLLPLHDTSPDRERIQSKLLALEAALPGARDEDAAVLQLALGRGYLALGEEEKALVSLKKAWELNYRKPRVSYALAQALGLIYQEKLLALERDFQLMLGKDASDKTVAEQHRSTRKQQLATEYRDPAVQHLEALTRLAPSETPAPPLYLDALLAFHQERYDDALARINAMGDETREFYAALKLKGDILRVSAIQHWNQGQPQEALLRFEAARRAYVQAADSGRSDPFIHYALALLESAVVDMETYYRRDKKVLNASVDQGLQAVARALKAAPNHYESHVLRARLFRRFAEYRATQGQDAPDAVHTAIASALRATTLKPERSEARMELGRCYWRLGRSRMSRALDPGDWFRQAQEILQLIPEEERDEGFYLLQGNVHKIWADHEDQQDPLKNTLSKLDVAIAAYRRMIQMNEARVAAWISLAGAYISRTQRMNSPDPRGDLEQAHLALQKARALNPRHINLAEHEGTYHEQLARKAWARGEDPREHWKKALASYQQGLAVDPSSDSLLVGTGQSMAQLAQAEREHGGETSPLLDEARALFDNASRLAPTRYVAHSSLGELLAWRAVYQLADGKNPTGDVHAAIQAYKQAMKLVPEHDVPQSALGWCWSILAEYEMMQGEDPSKNLAEASAMLEAALRLNPRNHFTFMRLADVQKLEARRKARPEGFELAMATLQRAFDLEPNDQDIRLALGHLHREQASFQKEPLATLEKGLALAQTLVQQYPHWADALLLRASLTLARLEVLTPPDPQPLEQARQDIDRALKLNRHLARQAQQLRSRFQKLLR